MNRRELLQRGGALTTAAALSGCLGSASQSNPADRETTTLDDSEETTTDGGTGDDPETGFGGDFTGVRSDRDEPFSELAVGSRDDVAFPDYNRPHVVRIWNAADEPRDLLVRASRGATEPLDRTVEFGADAYLTATLNEPGDYRLAVGVADDEPTTFEIARSLFDCNYSTTDVGVAPDGSVATVTESTTMACPGPQVAGFDFSVGRGTCGTENRASVEWDGERVRVEGTVRTPTPQSDLTLGDASYDEQSGTLTLRVKATSPDDPGPGVQCVGSVPYEASVEFEYALPDEVVVVHESMDETREVARATR